MMLHFLKLLHGYCINGVLLPGPGALGRSNERNNI